MCVCRLGKECVGGCGCITDVCPCVCVCHTLSTVFRHLPPNSARFSYATEGTLYLRAAVHQRGQRPPKGSGTNMTVEAT